MPAAAPGGEPGPAGLAGGRAFLTLGLGEQDFALPLEAVREVIRLPPLAPVPLAPPSLAGLANLRGRVLPVADLRRLLRRAARPADAATRVLVLTDGAASFGLVVDRVGRLLRGEACALAAPPPSAPVAGGAEGDSAEGGAEGGPEGGDTALLDGVIGQAAGGRAIPVLAPGRLLRRDFAARARPAAAAPPVPLAAAAPAAEEASLTLVTLSVAGQDYALPVEAVAEIAPAPAGGAQGLGVLAWRGRVLPLLSLRALLGLPAAEAAEAGRGRLLVLRLGEAGGAGLLVDRQGEVLRVPAALVDPVPPLLARRRPGLEVTAICRLEQGRRLVGLLSPAALFRLEGLRLAADAAGEDAAMAAAGDQAEAVFLVFRLGGAEYAVPVAEVEEVLRLPDRLTRVPRAPEFLEGVLNLRGAVLPVLDQRRRFGLPAAARSGRERIIVHRIAGGRAGFIVDAVSELLRVPVAAVEPAPALAGEAAAPLVTGVVHGGPDGRLLPVLDSARLLEGREAAALAAGLPTDG